MSPQSGGSDQERTKKKRRGDRYSVQTSLIVATLKKMLPIGLNMCAPTDQDLIVLAKARYALVLIRAHPAPYCFWDPGEPLRSNGDFQNPDVESPKAL